MSTIVVVSDLDMNSDTLIGNDVFKRFQICVPICLNLFIVEMEYYAISIHRKAPFLWKSVHTFSSA